MQRVRVAGDYLQPAAVLNKAFESQSAFTDRNDYQGPGTGYRLKGEHLSRLSAIPQARSAAEMVPVSAGRAGVTLKPADAAVPQTDKDVVIAVGPAFASELDTTLCGLTHGEVLDALVEGIASKGLRPRIVKIYHTADCGMLGYEGAKLSGSGIAIGLQSKGTAVIQRKGLAPLNNLELFSQAPLLSREAYVQIGANAASHARRQPPSPVPVKVDNMARLRLIVQAMLMHKREIASIVANRAPGEMQVIHD